MLRGNNKFSEFVSPMYDDETTLGVGLMRIVESSATMRSPPDPLVGLREIKILEVLRVSQEVSCCLSPVNHLS